MPSSSMVNNGVNDEDDDLVGDDNDSDGFSVSEADCNV